MSLEIPCPNCGVYVNVERFFCLKCGHRLVPLTRYDVTIEDFIYPPDRDGLDALKQVAAIYPIVNKLVLKKYIKSAGSWLSENAVEVGPSSELGSMLRECGLILGLKSIPKAYILRSDEPNAFTFGSDKLQFLVISSGLLEILSDRELKAVIGHELGHVKCDHVVYHTLAELLTRGILFSSNILGLGLESLSPIFKILLLSWHRESEVSADRASLLVVNDPNVIKSLLAKLIIHNDQRRAGKPELIDDNIVNSISELFSTHPTYSNRIKMLMSYYRSSEYLRVKAKIEKRLKLSKALMPVCRFCGARKEITDLFCPKCGRSQL